MKSNIVARKYEVTPDIKERLEKKLAKLDKFFPEETSATVTFSSKRGRDNVEITIFYKSMTYRAEVYETDAVIQMNLTSHDFFVYKNEKDDKVNIVYKRYDGGYGLLEVQ